MILFGRFICSTILHLSMVDKVQAALEMMKFTCNHPYKFHSYPIAFSSALLQFVSTVSVEVASIGVICAATDVIDIIFNFIALAILAEFDDFVYSSLKNESFKELVEKEFVMKATVVKHTTSKKCDTTEVSDEIDPETGELRPLKIDFKQRSLGNKIYFATYKFWRTFYAALFFYFVPFSVIIISSLIPIFNRDPLRPLPPP